MHEQKVFHNIEDGLKKQQHEIYTKEKVHWNCEVSLRFLVSMICIIDSQDSLFVTIYRTFIASRWVEKIKKG